MPRRSDLQPISKVYSLQWKQSIEQLDYNDIKVENLLDPQRVENGASATPQTLTRPPTSFDLWPPDPEVDRFMPVDHLCQIATKSIYLLWKYHVHKFVNRQTDR